MNKTKLNILEIFLSVILCFAVILSFGACGEKKQTKDEITQAEITSATTVLSALDETFTEISTKNNNEFFTRTEQVSINYSFSKQYSDIDDNIVIKDIIGQYTMLPQQLKFAELLKNNTLHFNKLYVNPNSGLTTYFELDNTNKKINVYVINEEGTLGYMASLTFNSDWTNWVSDEEFMIKSGDSVKFNYSYIKLVNTTNTTLRPYFDNFVAMTYKAEPTDVNGLQNGQVVSVFETDFVSGKYYKAGDFNASPLDDAGLKADVLTKLTSLNIENIKKNIFEKAYPYLDLSNLLD